ncbi:hypothetical protein [Hyphomicrobium sp. ghe19]|uniref:hypothetical protein n=1 Tax=Hyphomicrobium sp. ghe19 TaxID=2682968 RepID=UPI001366A9E3|nr:hypothetical protein HYPP_03702 [Hyphomicrobium sp. ghe19]
MKTIAIAFAVCAAIASSAVAASVGVIPQKDNSIVRKTDGHGGGGGDGGRWGGPGVGVVVDVPWEAMGYGNQPAADPAPNRCREARHACFDQWGTDGRGYGQCMRANGC